MNFEAILTVNFWVFCVAISGLTEIFNRLMRFLILDNPKFSMTRTSLLWKSVILPSAPVLIGLILGLATGSFAFPAETLLGGKIMLSVVAGLSSTLAYAALKTMIGKYISVKEAADISANKDEKPNGE